MPAATFLPVIGLSLGVPMLAFAILRLGWFFTCRVDKNSGAKTFLIMMGAPAALALLTSTDWSNFASWLRVPLILMLLAFTFISGAFFLAAGFVRERAIQVARTAHPTWLTGLSIGIIGMAAAVATRVGWPSYDTAPLLTAHVDMIQLRSINLLSVVGLLLVALFYLEDLHIVGQMPEGGGATGWRNVGLLVVAFGLNKLISFDPLPERRIDWFLDVRTEIAAIPLYRLEDFQEILIALWQRDAMAVLIISMIAVLLLLPLLLTLGNTAGWRRLATAFAALSWLAFAGTFALIYPAGEFDLALFPHHGFFLISGLAIGAILGKFALNWLHTWREAQNAPHLLRKLTPGQLLLLALVALLVGAYFASRQMSDLALALTFNMSLRFGVIAFATVWSVRYCARIYEGNNVGAPVATANTPALETQRT